jgi:hypothetical protein
MCQVQQHIDQHADYVNMLQFLRRIINSGDCMLGVDGSVEIHATADDLRSVNRMAAKSMEGLPETHQRAQHTHDYL